MKTKNRMLTRIVATCAFLLALALPCAASDIQNPSPATAATTPGGAANSIQFNNGGAFGGFGSWNGTTFTVPGAANSLNLAGSSTGNPVTLTATGSDSVVPIYLTPKSDAPVVIASSTSLTGPFFTNYAPFAVLAIASDNTLQPDTVGTTVFYAAGTPSNFDIIHSNGSVAVPTATLAGDIIGQFKWQGFGASAWRDSAIIAAVAAENMTNSASGGHLTFSTTPIGTTNSVERLKLTSEGLYKFATLSSNGFVKTSGGDGTLSVQTGGVTASGATCTITAITGGIITAGSCL